MIKQTRVTITRECDHALYHYIHVHIVNNPLVYLRHHGHLVDMVLECAWEL